MFALTVGLTVSIESNIEIHKLYLDMCFLIDLGVLVKFLRSLIFVNIIRCSVVLD